ncbi:DUF924 family protein [Pseudomonas akapageensis]|uniref:DUF924 family protein n=1 Tax=Pseudomonas akapageensis TaxID=2609961 RepID=UPI0014089F43|nr:DUF924 family protein [Pseudomonas akapageensis]
MPAPWQPLLHWWFGSAERPEEVAAQQGRLWFGKRDSQDAEARERFGDLVDQALAGGLAEWVQDPHGWLALILLLDQLPRMIYRDTPRAYAGDRRAQALVTLGLGEGREQQLLPLQQAFILLVLEHAEDLALQNLSVTLHQKLLPDEFGLEHALFADYLDYAEKHQKIIERFGRFPHRNAVLGRESTDEEVAFLRQPGSRF